MIDTGVKADHPDLAGNVLPGIDQTGDNSKGWRDTDGHGTGMAGLIAAHGHGAGQDSGVMGIAPRAKILPIRTKTEKIGIAKNLASAVDQAEQRGVTVISMSLGTGTNPAFEQALQRALDADVVIVGSTGNKPNDVFVSYPGVVAVGATGRDGTVAPVTVTGKEMVLTAPGTDIVSTDGIGGYSTGTGTSGATALVAGAAALIRSRYPDLTATEVIQRLTTTAVDKGKPGRDPQYGYGALDLVAALGPAVPAGAAETTRPPEVVRSCRAGHDHRQQRRGVFVETKPGVVRRRRPTGSARPPRRAAAGVAAPATPACLTIELIRRQLCAPSSSASWPPTASCRRP